MSPRTTLNSSSAYSRQISRGFHQGGYTEAALIDFDKRLNKLTEDTLALRNERLSKAKRAELKEEIRKQPLPDEVDFEKKLAKAYRKDYGQDIPPNYLEQAVKCIKNLLERVRFYTYDPSAIPIEDYAPPMLDGERGGGKFEELETKSWASISEPGDERYPGWYQSDTPKVDIMRWLQDQEEEAAGDTRPPASKSKRDTATQDDSLSSPSKKQKNDLSDALPKRSNKRKSGPKASSSKPSRKLPTSPLPMVEDIPVRGKSADKESVNMDTLAQASNKTSHRPEGSQSPRRISAEIEKEIKAIFQDNPSSTAEDREFPSAPTPGEYFSPSPRLPAFDWAPQRLPSPIPSRWQSRVPTSGLNHLEELTEALQKKPVSVRDVTHYFNLAHQGTKGQRIRALFRLSRDIAEGKDIRIDRYLTGSGPSSRQASPSPASSWRTQSQPEEFGGDETNDLDMLEEEIVWSEPDFSWFDSDADALGNKSVKGHSAS